MPKGETTSFKVETGDIFHLEIQESNGLWWWELLDPRRTLVLSSEPFEEQDDAFVNAQDFLFAVREAKAIVRKKS